MIKYNIYSCIGSGYLRVSRRRIQFDCCGHGRAELPADSLADAERTRHARRNLYRICAAHLPTRCWGQAVQPTTAIYRVAVAQDHCLTIAQQHEIAHHHLIGIDFGAELHRCFRQIDRHRHGAGIRRHLDEAGNRGNESPGIIALA